MDNSKNIENIVDAFIALRDVPDEAVADMIKKKDNSKIAEGLTEGKSFDIYNYHDATEMKDFFDSKVDAPETELVVIDPDANALRHLKDPSSYIGQAILNCNRCKSNVFIDMDKLNPDENDETLYNVDDECPHCHATATGYSLIGQVGKVAENAEEEIKISDTDETNAEASESTAEETISEEPQEEQSESESLEENPEESSNEEETFTFDNEEESEEGEAEPAEEVETTEDLEEVETLESDENEEDNGMETSESEEDLEEIEKEVTTKDGKKLVLKLNQKKLGDVYEEDFSYDTDRDEVNEALADEVTLDANDNTWGEEAWKLGQIMIHMNDEDAYFGGWLYIWPDGESYEECLDDFNDKDEYEDLEASFIRNYRRYHSGGLFEAPANVEEWAHEWDKKLGLKPIENLFRENKAPAPVDECQKFNSISEFFKRVNHPERIDAVVVADKDYDPFEDRVYPLFEGVCDEMSADTLNCKVDCFDVGDGYLTCNIDCTDTDNNDNLKAFLDRYCDDKSDKVVLWDIDSSDECFQGCKDDAINKYGNCAFKCIEAPKVLIIRLDDNDCKEAECDVDEKTISDDDKLVNQIYKANGLNPFDRENPDSNEFWVSESIKHKEELASIYEQFIKPVADRKLTENFKSVTGFKEAKIDLRSKRNSDTKSSLKENLENLDRDELQSIVDGEWNQAVTDLSLDSPVDEFVSYFDKSIDPSVSNYNPQTLKTIVNNKLIRARINKARKNSEEDSSDVVEAVNEEVVKSYSKLKESRQSFKTRKELAAAISECRKNNRPYTVRRSLTEGYRYDLIPGDNPDDWKADDLDAKSAEYEEEQRVLRQLADEDDANGDAKTDLEEDNSNDMIELIDDDDEIEVVVDEHPAQMSEIDQALISKITRIAKDINEAIKETYNIDINPGLIVADIIQDLRLISHEIRPEDLSKNNLNRLTINMFRSYEATMEFIDALMSTFTGRTIESTPESRLTRAVAMLDSPAFEREAIFKGIQSDAFLEAARAGAVPYMTGDIRRELPPANESIEFPTDKFDADMNEYFKSNYPENVIYETKSGAVDKNGNIVLEGVLELLSDNEDKQDLDVKFILTPTNEVLSESIDVNSLEEKLNKLTYKVTNNLSEEVFEFKV